MPTQIVKRRSRGFICVNAHPEGCRVNVQRQIEAARQVPYPWSPEESPFKHVLVIGSSTGYGLASRIAAAWGYGARTLGIFLERVPDGNKTASAGYYNTVALDDQATRDGLVAKHINGDAFSDACKREAIAFMDREFSPVDLVIYSLASPKRTDPAGVVHASALKPIGAPFTSKTIDLDSEEVTDITIEPASEKEIADTVAVMGGDDWRLWIEALESEGLLAKNARTIAYSYIGPELTWPVYRDGTIGRAKQDLDRTAAKLDELLQSRLGGRAIVSVNKAVVTQASAAIPVVPLYVSLLMKVMAAKGVDEGPIEQMLRLFADYLADEHKVPATDAEGRIRLDDREMRADVQAEVAALWPRVNTENLRSISDFGRFQRDFRNLFGFEVEGVNYDALVETDLTLT